MEIWESWTKVKNEINSDKLTIVVFSQKWNTLASPVTKFLASQENPRIFFVDISIYFGEARNYGVMIGPSILAFVKGKPLLVQRTGYPDDIKYVGNTNSQNLINFLNAAQICAQNGMPIVCD